MAPVLDERSMTVAPGRWLKVLGWLALATAVAAGVGPRVAGYAPEAGGPGVGPLAGPPARVQPTVEAVAAIGEAGSVLPTGPVVETGPGVGNGGEPMVEPMPVERAQPASSIVRLHIIANSDSAQDQAVKLKVRDALVPLLVDVVAGAPTPDAALARVAQQAGRLEARARAVVRATGFRYGVRIETGPFPYEERRLGDTVYPAGTYPAVRVILGAGGGHNFWCVLFPGLCWLGDPGPAAAASGPAEASGPAGTAGPAGAVGSEGAASGGTASPGGGTAPGSETSEGSAWTAGVAPGPAVAAAAPAAGSAAGGPGAAGATSWQAAPAPRWFLLEWWQASVGRWWASLGWTQRTAAAR